jgi:hypothetical protein
MNPDADMDLLGFGFLNIMGAELALNLLGAPHRMHDRGEVDQEGVAHGFNDRAMRLRNGLLDELSMYLQQAYMRGSSAPIWRLKPTMSVNMIAARRRVSRR